MRRLAIILSIMLLANPARAELRTLPGGTTQIAVTRVGCFIAVDGQELMNGICHHRLSDSAELFMTLPEAATQTVVYVERRWRAGLRGTVKLWSRTADGKEHREPLGNYPIRQQADGCHANDRVRICFWPQ